MVKKFTDNTLIRQVGQLSSSVAMGYGIIEYSSPDDFVQACDMKHNWLGSEPSKTLVNRTINQLVDDPTFYYQTTDKNSPMWQTIAALCVGSATSQHLFLQGPPGSGKTVAVRHFSENRNFHRRSPVYSVACSAETTTEQFFGSIVFESNAFRFNDGPLVQAAKEGAVFLADEFNLLPQNVMLSLLPFLSGKAGDTIKHPDIPNDIVIASGFVFVATGNEDNERGRNKLPDCIKNLLKRIEVNIGSDEHNSQIIDHMIQTSLPSKNIVKSTQIIRLMKLLKESIHITWSLRNVRRFIERIKEFNGKKIEDQKIVSQYSIIPISPIHIAMTFILSGPRFDNNFYDDIVNELTKIFNAEKRQADDFGRGRTIPESSCGQYYLIRGNVALPIENDPRSCPQTMLNIVFWLRWAGKFSSSSLRESVILVGPTGCKAESIKFLLSDQVKFKEHTMTRNTQFQS